MELVTRDDQEFLVDVNNCRPIALSGPARRVLRALREGGSLDAVRTQIGGEVVDAVLQQLAGLEASGVLPRARRDFRAEAIAHLQGLPAAPPAVLEGVLMVAQDCNLACRYCYGGHAGQFDQRGLMSADTAERCLRTFLSLGGGREFQKIVFLGGEPLLNLPVIQHVVERWQRWRPEYPGRQLFFSMTTNGVLVDREVARYLKQNRFAVTVSADGPADMHDAFRVLRNGQGSFDRVMAGMQTLREEDVSFSARVTVTRRTDLPRLRDFFSGLGIKVEYLIPVDFPTPTPVADYQLSIADYQRLAAQQHALLRDGCEDIKAGRADTFNARQLSITFHSLRNYEGDFPFRCTAGTEIIAFGIDGVIYPCQRFVGRSGFAIGDLTRGLDLAAVTTFYRRFLDASEACERCWVAHLCRRRCFFQRACSEGAFAPIPTEVCDMYRDSYAAALGMAFEVQRHARANRRTFEDMMTRYDADRLLREHRAAEESAR